MKPLLTGIFTLTPTHCGTGQANGPIDLPIARDVSTGMPILPATSLKGAARAALEGAAENGWPSAENIDWLFGPELKDSEAESTDGRSQEDAEENGLRAGVLSFGEGQLLAYPFRSLRPPLFFATCPLLLERLARALRARPDLQNHAFVSALTGSIWESAKAELRTGRTLLSTNPAGPIVLEDRLIPKDRQAPSPLVEKVGRAMVGLLPAAENDTKERILRDLLIVPDELFAALVRTASPVQARVKLTSGKTTSEYKGGGQTEKGNLWYEETLPSDCLFWSLIESRAGATLQDRKDLEALLFPKTLQKGGKSDSDARGFQKALSTFQIGGNETVGQGLCFLTMEGMQ